MTTSRISGIIPLLVISLICVGMVEGGYQLFEHFILDASDSSYEAEVSAADTTAKRSETKGAAQKKIDYRIISQRNLFGPPPDSDKSAKPPVPDNKEVLTATSLAIVLVGTVTGSEGVERAIILDKKSQKQDLYEKGDAVQGALVKEIGRGKVILARDGGDEILDISEAAKVRPPVPAVPVAAPGAAGQSGTPAQVEPRPSGAGGPGTPANEMTVPAQAPQVASERARLSRESLSSRRKLMQNNKLTKKPQSKQGE